MKSFGCYLMAFSIALVTSAFGAGNFEQLGSLLPAPNEARLASGAPGPGYWQQEANYDIEVELDESASMIRGSERIEYVNHSPHDLRYLWLQLDQNAFSQESARARGDQPWLLQRDEKGGPTEVNYRNFRSGLYRREFEGGVRLGNVESQDGGALAYQIVDTNMRIDLDTPLKSGGSIRFSVEWEYEIPGEEDSMRTGKKKMKDGDYAYQIAQWYPRMCAYYDNEGWQVKPYLGAGEFALEFGSFNVAITVPDDFVVGATGDLTNALEVLSEVQRDRLEEARESELPVMVVTEEEAAARLADPSEGKKTWRFHADKVRDFAFAASRGYLWDARGVEIDGNTVMAMSLYPKESYVLWNRYSTEAIVQALKVYSDLVYPYPYPVAWSTWGSVYGMEYPMISFQSSWDIDEKETYPENVRNYVIGVVVHEVGHNWFPMIINNDERLWGWQDEGLNSFVEAIANRSFDPKMLDDYEKDLRKTIATMAGSEDPPIMVTADDLTRRGFQAYTKPSLSLIVLRESILGPELFDFAFKEYARRWAFKRPLPSDFFRTMEDASGVDLDWFWRGWYYGSDHVDLAVESVEVFELDDGHPERSKQKERGREAARPSMPEIEQQRRDGFVADSDAFLQDWYFGYDKYTATEKEVEEYEKGLEELKDWQRELLKFGKQIYIVKVRNFGGLVMPMVLDITFEDGSEKRFFVPVDAWRGEKKVLSLPYVFDQPVVKVELDRDNAFADADLDNNVFPQSIQSGHFKLKADEKKDNPMKEALFPEEDKEEGASETSEQED